MARAQFARDAVMATQVATHAPRGLALIAGNGHVRRDIGVPRWLGDAQRARVWSVGYLEPGSTAPPGAFDAVVRTAAVTRDDPCIAFRQRMKTP
jgi:uncharacterized iron-regulated protein